MWEKDLDVGDCLDPVDEAVRVGVLSATATSGRAEFSRGAVRSVIAARISLSEQVRMHARAARAIEELAGGQVTEHLGVLTYHWSAAAAGAASAEACRWARRAGQLAPAQAHTRPPEINLADHRIRRKQVLGGLTHEYQIAA